MKTKIIFPECWLSLQDVDQLICLPFGSFIHVLTQYSFCGDEPSLAAEAESAERGRRDFPVKVVLLTVAKFVASSRSSSKDSNVRSDLADGVVEDGVAGEIGVGSVNRGGRVAKDQSCWSKFSL